MRAGIGFAKSWAPTSPTNSCPPMNLVALFATLALLELAPFSSATSATEPLHAGVAAPRVVEAEGESPRGSRIADDAPELSVGAPSPDQGREPTSTSVTSDGREAGDAIDILSSVLGAWFLCSLCLGAAWALAGRMLGRASA